MSLIWEENVSVVVSFSGFLVAFLCLWGFLTVLFDSSLVLFGVVF